VSFAAAENPLRSALADANAVVLLFVGRSYEFARGEMNDDRSGHERAG